VFLSYSLDPLKLFLLFEMLQRQMVVLLDCSQVSLYAVSLHMLYETLNTLVLKS